MVTSVQTLQTVQTVQERVAHLEGRAMEQTKIFDDIRASNADIRQTLRSLDDKTTKYFMWLVGIYVTGLLAIMAMLGR